MFRILVPFLLLTITPMAAAIDPVEGCTQQCTAKADDVNGPEVRTGDATVKQVFFFHYQSLIDSAPINAQPLAQGTPEVNEGFLVPTVSIQGTGSPADGAVAFDFTTFTGISSAGFVEWGDGGERRSHTEPGFAEEFEIIGDTIPLYFYFSAYPLPGQSSDSMATGAAVMPQVGVRAKMQSGRVPGLGDVIAEGDTGATDLVKGVGGAAGRVNLITVPNAPDIYEVRVDMSVLIHKLASTWDDGNGFTVTVQVYQVAPEDAAKGTKVTQEEWRVRMGPSTPPHLVIEMAKPLQTKNAKLSLFNGGLFVRWSVVSPLGSYDFDEPSIAIHLAGPTTVDPSKVGLSRPLIVKRGLDHNAHFKPINVTWKMDYGRAGLADGAYTLHISALNLAGTYRIEESLTFNVKDGQPTDVETIGRQSQPGKPAGGGLAGNATPGPESLGLLAALGAAFVLGRRRKA